MSAVLPSIPATGAAEAAARVRFRRALVLMLMTVVAPGSAQVAAGNKRIGRIALRCALVGLVAVVSIAVIALAARPELVTLFTNIWILGALRVALILYAVGWAYLIVDAWRIADPLALGRRQRLVMTSLNGVLCFSLSGALLFASHFVAVQKDFIQTVFVQHTVSNAQHGRYNVLLLGGDAGPMRVGLRPDSITLASIDQQTGRTVLFGLPRNLEHVPFPKGSVMYKQFPHGFNCSGCLLNAVNTWATEHPKLFPGVKNPGIEATTEAVEQITGLHVNYYVLIDLRGFQDLVDAVGGVTINVHSDIPIGGEGGKITGHIHPGVQHLDGYRALWFARSRATSDDYSRMARQKCVMNAMLHQLNPQTVLTRFGAIAAAGKQVISTSIPASQLGTFVNLALKARQHPVSTVSFVPPMINTGAPDWKLIRAMVANGLAKAEGVKAPPTILPKPKHLPPDAANHPANQSANLNSAC